MRVGGEGRGEGVEKGLQLLKMLFFMIEGSFEADLMTFWKSNVIKMEISARSSICYTLASSFSRSGTKNDRCLGLDLKIPGSLTRRQ